MQHATIRIDQDPGDTRFSKRYDKRAPGTVRTVANIPIDVRLTDISTEGFAFESDLALPVGTTISIGVASLQQRHATIVRQDGMLHGCVFQRPIPHDLVARVGQANTASLQAATFDRRFPDPVVEPWSPRTRLAILVAGMAGAWGLVAALATTLLF